VAYLILLALGALDAAGYSVIAPVVPEIAQATDSSAATIGILVATFPVGMMVGFALAGTATKRLGPKPVILSALTVVALGCAGFVLGSDLPAYFTARFVMGLGSGGLWIGITFDTLGRWPGQEYLCMSRIFSAYSAGGLIGPALGAISGIHGPFFAYGALVLAALALVAVMPSPTQAWAFTSDRSALRLPGFWAASAAILFTVLGLGIVEGVLPLHLSSRLGQSQLGLVYASVSLLVAGSAALAARFRPRADVLVAAALITAGLGLAGATDTVALWVLSLLLTGIGVGLGNTGSIGMLLESVRPERIVTAMIIWSQIGIGGYLIGPVAAGSVAESFGFAALGLVPLVAAIVVLSTINWASRATPGPLRADP
jgi:MFS family permease